MNVTVIHGTNRKSSTYHSVEAVLNALGQTQEIGVKEFFVPRDMPNFCIGCGNCFSKGEEFCPHRAAVQPIWDALLWADLIILSSPVYVFDVSGSLKALLDHFGYRWIAHRPSPEMFAKVGLVVSTTAGAGLAPAMKTMRTNLKSWGVRRVYTMGTVVHAIEYSGVNAAIKEKIQQKAAVSAKKLLRAHKNVHRRLVYPYTAALWFVSRMVHKIYSKKNAQAGAEQNIDYRYWEKMGWIDGKKPY